MSPHGSRPLMGAFRSLPPGFDARACDGDCVTAAVMAAEGGADGGTLFHNDLSRRCTFAVVLIPGDAVTDAAVCDLAGRAIELALAGMAPVGLPIATVREGGVVSGVCVNGGMASWLSLRRSEDSADGVPNWLVLGVDVAVDAQIQDPGLDPSRTCLIEEGFECAAQDVLAAICRHLLAAFDALADLAEAERAA